MDLDIREVLEGAKELKVASEQLMAKTQLLQAKAARQTTEENRWIVVEGELLCDSPVCVTRLNESVRPLPRSEERVQQLCKQIVDCKTEAEAVELVPQLKVLLHDALEELRGK